MILHPKLCLNCTQGHVDINGVCPVCGFDEQKASTEAQRREEQEDKDND